MEGHILACSSPSEELFLLGPDMDEVKKVWSIPSIIRTSAEPFSKLLHVSALDDQCLLCFLIVGRYWGYQISLKK